MQIEGGGYKKHNGEVFKFTGNNKDVQENDISAHLCYRDQRLRRSNFSWHSVQVVTPGST